MVEMGLFGLVNNFQHLCRSEHPLLRRLGGET